MKKILFLLALLLLSACGNNSIKPISIDDYEKTYIVNTGEIYSNNKYVGVLKSDKTTYLAFKLPGRITNLYLKEGDFVKKGQLLASLDGNEVKTQFSSAKDMLKSLYKMYSDTEKMFNAQIKSMESKVSQAKAAMEGFKIGFKDTKNITKEQVLTAEKQLKQAKIGLETAKTNLEHTKNILKQKEQDIYSNSKNAIAQSKILLNNFIVFVDQLFGVSDKNKHKNDSFENYISAKNTALKEQIKDEWTKLNLNYNSWTKSTEKLLFDIKNSDSLVNDEELKSRIYNNLKETRDLLIKSRLLADKVYQAIDNSVSSRTLPNTLINTYKEQVTNFQNNIEKTLLTAQGNFLLGIKGSIQNIENFKKESQMKLDLLKKQYQLAQATYDTAKQSYEQYKAMGAGKVNEVNTKYEVAKKQYEEALRGLQALKEQKQVQLSQIKSQINQVKGNKNLAAVNLGNIKLYAPYDGIITKKLMNIGQVVGAGTPIYEIADPNNMKGLFYIPVEEVKNINLGKKVYISAIGKTITGEVIRIYPSADIISKKVPVEVKINKAPENWVIGMYISGHPIKESIKGLLIPHEFIHYEYGKEYVYKKINNKYKKVYIKLGKCDNNFCIVKEGLKKEDIIK